MVRMLPRVQMLPKRVQMLRFVTFAPFLVQMLPVKLKCYRVVTFAPFSVQLLPEFSSLFFLKFLLILEELSTK